MSSVTRKVGKAVMAPLIAAGTSVAATYVAKRGPQFAEETLLPWLRDAAKGAGGPAEKLQEKAGSAVSKGGDLVEQLADRTRDVTGLGDGGASGGERSGPSLSPNDLSRRSDERAQRRAQRRKTSKRQ